MTVVSKLFCHFDLESMSEADVEQIIVRPFLHALGYRQGTDANIRTQVSYRYGKYFFGRKKPKSDKELTGKPDFICEVVSYSRFIVEAKTPAEALTLDDSEQAHTYATYPEIAAEFYILTNGREFRLYRTFKPEEPLMKWPVDEIDNLLVTLQGILGPEAMKRRAMVQIDVGKPIAPGSGSQMQIIRGHIVYDRHTSDTLPLDSRGLDGLRNSVSGTTVERTKDGMIEATIEMESAYSMFDAINRAIGFKNFVFRTADEYVSTDLDTPTIFQNIQPGYVPPGTHFPAGPASPAMTLPFGFDVTCYTEAVGYLDGDKFLGTFAVDYDFTFHLNGLKIRLPPKARMRGEGRFELVVR